MEFLSFGSDRPQRQAVRQERSNLIHTSLAASLCLAESVARIAATCNEIDAFARAHPLKQPGAPAAV